jgi:hypothetical protein
MANRLEQMALAGEQLASESDAFVVLAANYRLHKVAVGASGQVVRA